MEKVKVLYVCQEVTPYLSDSQISEIGRYLPQGTQDQGKEIRTFMPRFGCINERRNQLHEVIRLSGMNLIIDDTDHPLIIKVASIQAARMQVYFIDNEDFFQRKLTTEDEKGIPFEDNDERMVFFARGVLETVKKLRWSPDIIHCHGWFPSMIPLYVKKVYGDDPFFSNSKVVYSMYDNAFSTNLRDGLENKVRVDGLDEKELVNYKKTDYVSLMQNALRYSDGLILGDENIDSKIVSFAKENNVPVLDAQPKETYVEEYNKFYDSILA